MQGVGGSSPPGSTTSRTLPALTGVRSSLGSSPWLTLSMTRGREVRLASRPVGEPTSDNFELVEAEVPRTAGRRGRGAQLVPVGRPVHARAHERRTSRTCRPSRSASRWRAGPSVRSIESRSPQLTSATPCCTCRAGASTPPGRPRSSARSTPASRRRRSTSALSAPPASRRGSASSTSPSSRRATSCSCRERRGRWAASPGRSPGSAAPPRVIGSAGSDEKVRHVLDDLGFDAAFNYRVGAGARTAARRRAGRHRRVLRQRRR